MTKGRGERVAGAARKRGRGEGGRGSAAERESANPSCHKEMGNGGGHDGPDPIRDRARFRQGRGTRAGHLQSRRTDRLARPGRLSFPALMLGWTGGPAGPGGPDRAIWYPDDLAAESSDHVPAL